MPDFESLGNQPVIVLLIGPGPIRHMMQSFAAGSQKIAVHGGRIVALLDEFNLQISRVCQCKLLDGY
jgi:hypothetical protein